MDEVGSLNHKIVCDYCGTIYSDKMESCPLCGSVRPAETEKRSEKQEKASSGKIPKPLMLASVVFLALSVVIMGWFILGQFFPSLDIVGNMMRSSQSQSVKTVACKALYVSPTSMDFTQIGSSQRIIFSTDPADSTDTVSFSSADETVVSVDAMGNVTAAAPGQTMITVSCGGCRVEVSVTVAKSLSFSEDQLSFDKVGQTQQLKIDGAAAEDFIDWTTTDRSVATVDEDGKVTAVGNGSCKVLATIADVTLSINVKVEAEPEPTEPETQPDEPRTGTLNTDGVNVRSGPSTDDEIVSFVSLGETVTVLEMDGEWCKIRTSAGVEGYIMDKFIHYED